MTDTAAHQPPKPGVVKMGQRREEVIHPDGTHASAALLADLSERLERAFVELTRMAADHGSDDPDGRMRLAGKASGVHLALSYVEEYRRGEH